MMDTNNSNSTMYMPNQEEYVTIMEQKYNAEKQRRYREHKRQMESETEALAQKRVKPERQRNLWN